THIYSSLFNDPAPTELYTLSLHDALPIYGKGPDSRMGPERGTEGPCGPGNIITDQHGGHKAHAHPTVLLGHGHTEQTEFPGLARSEEHTSELQSRENLVCRLLLEKKKKAG